MDVAEVVISKPKTGESYGEYRKRQNMYAKTYRDLHKERVKTSADVYRFSLAGQEQSRLYRQTPAYKASNNNWKQNNPEVLAFHNAKRRANKLSATPSWLTEDDLFLIQEAYTLAKIRTSLSGYEWQVDHIVPLINPIVCGLHVWWNMQVISASINAAKGNKHNVNVTDIKEVLGC